MPLTNILDQVDARLPDFEDSDLNKPIGEKEIKAATEILQRYKAGKANLDRRVVEDEEWWELRHWPFIRGNQRTRKNEETGEQEFDPESLTETWGYAEPSVKNAKPGERYQFFRKGYYIADSQLTTDEEKVFNSIVGLKSSWK